LLLLRAAARLAKSKYRAADFLPDDATRGEVAALRHFVEREDSDIKIAAAWRLLCYDPNARAEFSAQMKRLGKRVGRRVTHVDAIHAALRFWMLSMEDPDFAADWRLMMADLASEEDARPEIDGIALAFLMWASDSPTAISPLAESWLQLA